MKHFSFFSDGGDRTIHPAPTCGHTICTHLHNTDAGNGTILLVRFSYKAWDGSTKPVFIMGFERARGWNFFCEKMEDADRGCWIATNMRALREEAKIFLSRPLKESDIILDKFIGRTPVFLLQLDRTMVTHNLSRRILNAQVAADKANTALPKCYNEIKAIGFFEKDWNRLVHLPDNPSSYPNTFSNVVKSYLSS